MALLVLSFSGCELKFTALTKIRPDGSGFRITTFSADEESAKEELLKRYILPETGNWKTEEYTPSLGKVGRKVHIYESKIAFKDFNNLKPDYTRRGSNPDNLSKNRYGLKIKKGFMFNTYEYMETFSDSVNENAIRQFCQKEYDYALDKTAQFLEASFPGLIAKDEFRIHLDSTYRPYYDYFLSEFLKEGFKIFEDENREAKDKLAELGDKLSEDGFIVFVGDYIAKGHNKRKIDNKGLGGKLKEAPKKIGEELRLHWDGLSEDNYEDALGVYGIPIFVSYPFRVTVAMPGRIINSNSSDVKINTAKWAFYPSDFFLKEYRLEAKSRRLNYIGAGIMATGLVFLVILINLNSIRKLWK